MKKMTKHFKLYFGVLAALFLFVLVPGRAEAAGYEVMDVWSDSGSGEEDIPRKVGNYYVWAGGMGSSPLYTSKSPSKKTRTLIAKISQVYTNDSGGLYIYSNGKRAIYAKSSGDKMLLCGVDLDGKNKKRYDSVENGSFFVHEVSGGQIYFTKFEYGSKKGSLCSASVKTGKKKTLAKGKFVTGWLGLNWGDWGPWGSEGFSCHIDDQGTKAVVTLFDCKKRKVANTCTVRKSSSETVHLMQSGKYLYFAVAKKPDKSGNCFYKIYRCQKSKGGSAELMVKDLKAKALNACDGTYLGIGISGKKIYYCKAGKKGDTCYCYHTDTKTKKKISASSFSKISSYSKKDSWWFNGYGNTEK